MSDRDRTVPKNLEGVLRMAVENTQPGNQEAVQPLTEERRQFLAQALAEMQGPSPVERMQFICGHVSSVVSSGEDTELLHDELEELVEWCEDLDIACDFHKIGGFSVLPLLHDSADSELRWRCGALIGALCQNNPYCQEKILATDQMEKLIGIILNENEKGTVRVKALYALSALTRGNADAQAKFVKLDGYTVLLKAMQSHIDKLQLKAVFLLMGMMQEDRKHKGELTRMGFVQQIVALLQTEHCPFHEHIMAALLQLITENPRAQVVATRPELHLLSFLKTRMEELKGKPAFEEEFSHAREIDEILFEPEEVPMHHR